jgi:adenosylcobinamide hydrolase
LGLPNRFFFFAHPIVFLSHFRYDRKRTKQNPEVDMHSTQIRQWTENGVSYRIGADYVAVRMEREWSVLSNAPVNGGWRRTNLLVNRHVPHGYCEADPIRETKKWMADHGFDADRTVALLTAAWTDRAAVVKRSETGVTVTAVVTAGVSNAARAGKPGPVYRDVPSPGTINILLLVDGRLTEAAMVNTVITATEAKTAALQVLGVKDRDGDQATGTTTDVVAVAASQRVVEGVAHHYAGLATPLGQAVGQAVYRALTEALGG